MSGGSTNDKNGNRLSLTNPNTTETILGSYDAQDRLLAYGSNEYAFNENGTLTSKTNTATDETTTYAYDARGSLLSVGLPGKDIDYIVDGQGRRIGKKVNDVQVQGFLYKDGLRIAAELDGAGDVVAQFAYVGRSHSPDFMIKDGNVYRFLKDQLGSPRVIINAMTGYVEQQLEYDEFGNILNDTNPGFQPFGFAGGLYDEDTGLVRFGFRDYDPEVGRWTAKDPILFAGRQSNLYVYIGNDPLVRIDPSGLIQVGGGVSAGFNVGANWLYPYGVNVEFLTGGDHGGVYGISPHDEEHSSGVSLSAGVSVNFAIGADDAGWKGVFKNFGLGPITIFWAEGDEWWIGVEGGAKGLTFGYFETDYTEPDYKGIAQGIQNCHP